MNSPIINLSAHDIVRLREVLGRHSQNYFFLFNYSSTSQGSVSAKRLCSSDSSSGSVTETNLSTINISDIREDNEDTGTSTKSLAMNKNKKKAIPRWKFDDNMVEALLDNLISYKNEMTYNGCDFQSDLVTCYGEVRKMMAIMFPLSDFGPGIISSKDTDLMEPDELIQYKRRIDRLEKMKKDGYNRV